MAMMKMNTSSRRCVLRTASCRTRASPRTLWFGVSIPPSSPKYGSLSPKYFSSDACSFLLFGVLPGIGSRAVTCISPDINVSKFCCYVLWRACSQPASTTVAAACRRCRVAARCYVAAAAECSAYTYPTCARAA
eukprot:108038-Heterocapsa_arctica.AAC.1